MTIAKILALFGYWVLMVVMYFMAKEWPLVMFSTLPARVPSKPPMFPQF